MVLTDFNLGIRRHHADRAGDLRICLRTTTRAAGVNRFSPGGSKVIALWSGMRRSFPRAYGIVSTTVSRPVPSICERQHVPTVVYRPVLSLAQETLPEQPSVIVADRAGNVAHDECADLQ